MLKIKIIANNVKWKSWPKKLNALYECFEQFNPVFEIEHTKFNDIPFTNYRDDLLGVDPTWYKQNITTKALGYDMVLLVLNNKQWKQPNRARGWRTNNDYGPVELQVGCDENQGFDFVADKYDFKQGFFQLASHEITHGLFMISGQPDTTHYYYDRGELEKAIKSIVLAEDFQISGLQRTINFLLTLLPKPMPKDLLPIVKRKSDEFIKLASAKGYTLRVTSGFRTIAEQNEIYAQGRTKPGKIVTNAKGGESLHNYGVAIDIVDRYQGYDVDWNELGKLGESLGFVWGGRWEGFKDTPHFEMTLGYSLEDFQGKRVDYKKFY